MVAAFPNLNLTIFKYLQIRHFFNSAQKPLVRCRDLSPLEQLCSAQESQRHLISTIYSMLTQNAAPNTNIRTAWDKDLSLALSDEDWGLIWEHTHKGFVNISAQENRYKLSTRWYRTPDKLQKIFPAVPPECWRCGLGAGSLLHIWWDCPSLQPFWKEVHGRITDITSLPINFSPAQFLLHHTSLPRSHYRKSLALHLVNAATQCIPLRWKSTAPPTIIDWHCRVTKIEEMERLIHQAKDAHDKYRFTWAC